LLPTVRVFGGDQLGQAAFDCHGEETELLQHSHGGPVFLQQPPQQVLDLEAVTARADSRAEGLLEYATRCRQQRVSVRVV